MNENRTTKRVTMTIAATFHGDYLDKDEVAEYLKGWIDRGLEDRDDLRRWKVTETSVEEIHGDPDGYDAPDVYCKGEDGYTYVRHDYADYGLDAPVCKRCGA